MPLSQLFKASISQSLFILLQGNRNGFLCFMVSSVLYLIWHPLTPYKPFHYSRRVRSELDGLVISGSPPQLKSQHKKFSNFLPGAEMFPLLGNTQSVGSHTSSDMQDWLKTSKLLCYKPLISAGLLILHFIHSLEGTTIDTQNYRYFHLKFLPSPWKSS